MNEILSAVIIVLALVIALYALYRALRKAGLDDPLLFALAALEILLLAQLVAGLVAAASTERDIESATFIGYLIGMAVLPPLAAVWALVERSRWGSAVIAVLGLVIAVMVVRLNQIWAGPVV
jgi:uncharacterized membrane protein